MGKMGEFRGEWKKWHAEASDAGLAYMHSRPLTRRSLSVQAQVALLAIAAIGSPACEIVSGLNGLEAVDCLSCDGALRRDSSGDAGVSDAGALDGSSEREPGESSADAGELDVLDSDRRDFDERRSDADADHSDANDSDADADHPDADADHPDADADHSDANHSDADADHSDADADHSDADAQCFNADSDCGSCMVVHANGVGQNFSDCTPLGTYNTAQAIKACVAYTGNSLQCRAATCGTTSVVCSSEAATSCACWAFAGPAAGHVKDSGQAGVLNCMCPGLTAPTWN